ncbi:AAA family ATPase [Billgrantia montanilacus]|uniref:Uncharacterized protein n=1 Tax=Billgrantia montanilacus TaxID=2282305 RepID=A0A368U092_9GAMM|nr:AAA family ATPase [Halomonas montanilacus]RCV90485.1 hypothetical protein DU505_05995 [Halomonas montanilacus]
MTMLDRAAQLAAEQLDGQQPFSLDQFALNGHAETMEAKMQEDKFILGRLAILGQSTVFYAKPNAGKTLLTVWLLIEAIKAGEIEPTHVFYVNADDNHKGLAFKLRLAEQYGFRMLAPGYNGFEAKMLPSYLGSMVHDDQAMGKILVLDTVKKFTDLMSKGKSSAFSEVVRQFVMHGGSVIMLAHVNKHRDEEQRVVYSGTSDLVDDCDCAYTLDLVTEEMGRRTAKFENLKNRGDVALEAVYEYDASEGLSYRERLESIRPVSDAERHQAEKRRMMADRLERNREAVDAIKSCLRDGICKKTELIVEAKSRAVVSRQKIERALKEHTGSSPSSHEYWHLEVADKNAHIYKLNWGGG